jgi:hypothetical protein
VCTTNCSKRVNKVWRDQHGGSSYTTRIHMAPQDKHGRIGITLISTRPRPRQTHKPSLLTALPCLELARSLAELLELPPKQALGHAAYCMRPPASHIVSSSLIPTRPPPSLYAYAYPLTLLPSLTYNPDLLRTCLPEPLACPPLSRGPERRIPQCSVLTQSHCPTTSHPPACLRAPLAMTPS